MEPLKASKYAAQRFRESIIFRMEGDVLLVFDPIT